MGHPVLRRPADPVPIESLGGDEIQRLLADMIDTPLSRTDAARP